MTGIVIIDKEPGWTSHDVVAKLRGFTRERRIGHGGTLDPMATGVLPMFIGRATRAVEFFDRSEKEYIAELIPGLVTDTQDIHGSVLERSGAVPGRDELEAVLERFRGDITQLPPMYSAVKVEGKKLYELARRGREVERSPRAVTVYELELFGNDGFHLRVRCSSGTYVRTLCHDIGQALGCGAVMGSLRRTRAGSYTQEMAVTLSEFEGRLSSGDAGGLILPLDSMFSGHPALTLSGSGEQKIRNGSAQKTDADDGTYRVYGPGGDFLALSRVERRTLTTIKSFFEV